MIIKYVKDSQNSNLDLSENVIVLGSSSNVLEQEKGSEIDSFESVIRFNRAPTAPFEKYIGTKTSVRVLNQHTAINHPLSLHDYPEYSTQENFIPNLKNTTICIIGPGVNQNYKNVLDSSNKVYVFDYNRSYEIRKSFQLSKIQTNLTVGFITVCLCILSGAQPTIYGFDLNDEKRSHFWEKRTPKSVAHNKSAESYYLKKFLDEERIKLL